MNRMNMKHVGLIGGMTLLVGLMFSSVAAARGFGGRGGMGRGMGPCGGGGGGGGGFGNPAVLASLNLSADQQKQIDKLRTDHQTGQIALRAELDTQRLQLRSLWQADKPDRQAILAQQSKMDTIRQKLRTNRTNFRLAVIDILTPEQQKQLRALPAWGRGHGAGKGFGPGQGRHGQRGGGPGFGRGAGGGWNR